MPLPESTVNLLLSGLMGLIGGLFTLPLNALLSSILKRDEMYFQHKLEIISKQRELLLQHKLKMDEKPNGDDIQELKATLVRLQSAIAEIQSGQ